jgi:hypothetical protein
MKRLLFIVITAWVAVGASAQFLTEGYLSKAPALPKDSCNIAFAQVESFTSQVSNILNQVDNAIAQMNRNTRQSAKANEAAAKEQAMKQMAQFGMSQEDMAKMKSGKMTAAEKQAMANKMMMQQTNISVDEMKAVSGMSQEGKKAYSEALTTEMMATGQAGQIKSSAPGNATIVGTFVMEQQQIMTRISDRCQKIPGLYDAIENDPERKQMLTRMANWKSKWTSLGGVDAGQGKLMDSLQILIKREQIKYCDKFTPLYRNALRKHLSVIKSSLPDYRRLAEITGQISESQTGVPAAAGGNDITGLSALKEYLAKLSDAYKYKLSYPEE